MDEIMEVFFRPVTNCSRCGRDHEEVEIRELRRPICLSKEIIWTHWGSCPDTGEPILVGFDHR